MNQIEPFFVGRSYAGHPGGSSGTTGAEDGQSLQWRSGGSAGAEPWPCAPLQAEPWPGMGGFQLQV